MYLRALDPCSFPTAMSDGRLEILLRDRPGRRPSVTIRLRPRRDLAAALLGRPVAEAQRVACRLLPGGGWSERLACLTALEAATGRMVDPATERARALLVQAEAAVQLVAQGCANWPRLLGQEPRLRHLQYARTALEALAARLWRGGDPLEPAARAASLGEAELPVSALIEALEASVLPGAPADAAHLVHWAARSPAPLARLARAAAGIRLETAIAPAAAVPCLPEVAAALAQSGGIVTAVADPTPFARMAQIPGAKLFGLLGARLLARAAQAQALTEVLARLDPPTIAVDAQGPGIGAALVEGLRGPVVLRLVCDRQGRVAAFGSMTPADWHSHPEGPLVATLAALPRESFHRAAPLVLAAFDPCDRIELRWE
jgi:hypothetical protein